jgi:hypothetical protein
MGLDMYVYKTEISNVEIDDNLMITKVKNSDYYKDEEFFYWRKHPAIHNWMENLYYDRGGKGTFNGELILLDKDTLKKLKKDLVKRNLNYETSGFFFGNSQNPDSQAFIPQLKRDLSFVTSALKEMRENENTVFIYDSSW